MIDFVCVCVFCFVIKCFVYVYIVTAGLLICFISCCSSDKKIRTNANNRNIAS